MQASDDRGEQSTGAVKWLEYFELLLNFKADDAADESQWEPENPFVDDKVHMCPITQQCDYH